MSWFVYSDTVSVGIDKEGTLEYNCNVRKHECRLTFGDVGLGDIAAFNRAPAGINIFPYDGRWRGSLGAFDFELHEPILNDKSKTKVVITYLGPGDGYPNGGLSFDVFLPDWRFEKLASHIERMLYSSSEVKMLATVGFSFFLKEPANWAEVQVPTLAQFRAWPSRKEHRPYVTDEVQFAFARGFPFAQ
jgi:hypothetical protein